MVEIKPIRISEVFEQARALAVEHWRETEADVSSTGPAPPLELYQVLEGGGKMLAFGAFDGDTMVGYVAGVMSQSLHYGFTYCAHDLLFVRKEHRTGSLGLRLMRRLEAAAASRGATFIAWHCKPGSTFQNILDRAGYKAEETIYRKEL